MKKFLAILLTLVLCIGVFAACSQENADLSKAKEYLYSLYVDKSTETATDLDYPARVKGGDTYFDVEWTVEIISGAGEVKVVDSETNGFVTVDVPDEPAEDIVYKLTATIKDAEGATETLVYEYTVPKFKLTGFAEYAAAADDSMVVCQGVVTAILSKTYGDSSNSLYFQDNDGGFYAYNISVDPVEAGIEIGMTVRVTGLKDTYNGTYEIVSGVAQIIDSNKAPAVPVDWTEVYKNAPDLKHASLTAQQSLLVTLKGVEITKQNDKYLQFKLGDKETYIYISSSNCPGTKDDENNLINTYNEKAGYIANVTGLVTLYNGSFYLTPVGPDAFEYLGLPEKSDAEMVEFEKDNLSIETTITENSSIELPSVGVSYDKVAITWAVEGDCAVIENGKLVITLPDEPATVKLIATLTVGEVTDTAEFELKVDSAPTDVYIPKFDSAPVADKAYKFGLVQGNLGKTLYITGEVSGRYLVMTDKADMAADVYVEAVEGGYKFYLLSGETKLYIDIYYNADNKLSVQYAEASTCVYNYNAEINAWVTNIDGTDYYLGTYNTFNTISASKTSYINAENTGVSQFPANFATLAPAVEVAEKVEAPEANKAYKFHIVQGNLGQTLYITGEVSGRYLVTTDKAAMAADVYVEAVDGGYKFYLLSGETKLYIDIYFNADNKVSAQYAESSNCVYNYDATTGAWVTNVDGTDYYLGAYNNFNTLSASKTSYINAENTGVSQFPAGFASIVVKEVESVKVETPAADQAYKFSIYQANLGQTLYITGEVSGRYLVTTDKLSKAADVYAEAVEGGYKFYLLSGETKLYIDIYFNADNKVSAQYVETSTCVYVYNAETGAWVTNVGGTDYYLGAYNQFNTLSASKTSYINAENTGISQFPAGLVSIQIVGEQAPETPETPEQPEEPEQPEQPETPDTPVEVVAPFANGDKIVIYATAYNKALSTLPSSEGSFYQMGVDVTVTDGTVTGYAETEIWTVIVNDDGTYSFAYNGQNLGMQDSYSSMSLGSVNDKWELVALENGSYMLKNVVRGNFVEWYSSKNNWSSYAPSDPASDDQFHLSFCVIPA